MYRTDRYEGALLGLAVGDTLGAPFEFWRRDAVVSYFKDHELEMTSHGRGNKTFPPGYYTDDTAMTICLAESLVEQGFNLDNQYDKYLNWYLHGYASASDDCCVGIGQQTIRALIMKLPKDKWDGLDDRASGNGGLMRTTPIGLYCQGNYNKMKEISILSCYLTHNNYLSAWTCVIMSALISLIVDGIKKQDLTRNIIQIYKDEIPEKIQSILEKDYKKIPEYHEDISGYSLHTLQIALWSFITSDSYSEGIKKSIMLGGDTDTFASVSGALLGAYFGERGIPNDWTNDIMKSQYIRQLANELETNVDDRNR